MPFLGSIGNRVRWAWSVITRAKAKQEKQHQLSLEGKTTSGHLTPGERQRIFRNRPKRP